MAQTIFEEMGGTYTQVRDYLLPDLKLPEEEWRISAYGDSGLSFFMFFIELVLFSGQYLILRGGMLYFTTIRYIRQERNI
mgnify:CR=1 FL=1